MRGVTFPWRRGLPPPWRGEKGGAGRTPHGLLPPSPIYVGHAPLLTTHLVLSIPYLVAPPWLFLKRSATGIGSHQHLEKWRRRMSFGGSLLLLPRWIEGMEDVTKPYVWPSTEVPPVVAPCTRSWDCQVNDYVDYVCLHRVFIGNVCAGT
jgi:hypothetical protein